MWDLIRNIKDSFELFNKISIGNANFCNLRLQTIFVKNLEIF